MLIRIQLQFYQVAKRGYWLAGRRNFFRLYCWLLVQINGEMQFLRYRWHLCDLRFAEHGHCGLHSPSSAGVAVDLEVEATIICGSESEMRQVKRWIWIGLLTTLATLAACGSPAEEAGGDQAGTIPDNITCEVFYRPAPGAAFQESIVTLPTAGDQGSTTGSAEFDDMRFEATFLSDAGEGQSLSIAVTYPNTDAEITRGLYQFDPQAGLRDQFVGGHGFTGLAYVLHPSASSEIQYFCGVGE
ncbi:MAG: hypothetical protein JSW55_02105 [Chloroflexota bacterium]|nr:MAG: hypothetical protein JSW55_02105 [Chloroflexota bacterium]